MRSKGKRAEEYRWLLDDVVLCEAIIRSVHIPIVEHLSLSLPRSLALLRLLSFSLFLLALAFFPVLTNAPGQDEKKLEE
jgi:hypothetical protein